MRKRIQESKQKIVDCLVSGLKLADQINQSWLVFKGAIIIWNNYLTLFSNKSNDSKLFPDIHRLLKEFFEVMKTH